MYSVPCTFIHPSLVICRQVNICENPPPPQKKSPTVPWSYFRLMWWQASEQYQLRNVVMCCGSRKRGIIASVRLGPVCLTGPVWGARCRVPCFALWIPGSKLLFSGPNSHRTHRASQRMSTESCYQLTLKNNPSFPWQPSPLPGSLERRSEGENILHKIFNVRYFTEPEIPMPLGNPSPAFLQIIETSFVSLHFS